MDEINKLVFPSINRRRMKCNEKTQNIGRYRSNGLFVVIVIQLLVFKGRFNG